MSKKKKLPNEAYHAAAMLLGMRYDEDMHFYIHNLPFDESKITQPVAFYAPDTMHKMHIREAWQTNRYKVYKEVTSDGNDETDT